MNIHKISVKEVEVRVLFPARTYTAGGINDLGFLRVYEAGKESAYVVLTVGEPEIDGSSRFLLEKEGAAPLIKALFEIFPPLKDEFSSW